MSKAAATDQPKLEPVPKTWPGAFGIYKYSRDAVMFNIRTLLLGIVAYFAVYVAYGIISGALNFPQAVDALVQFFITVTVIIAEAIIYFAGIDREKITLTEAVSRVKPFLFQGLVLGALCYLIVIGSLLALIVPFFFIAPRIALVPYYLIRQNMDALESISASWKQTKGNVGKVYGIVGVSILIVLLAVTIIGIPFAIYFSIMYGAAFNLLYSYLVENDTASAKA